MAVAIEYRQSRLDRLGDGIGRRLIGLLVLRGPRTCSIAGVGDVGEAMIQAGACGRW